MSINISSWNESTKTWEEIIEGSGEKLNASGKNSVAINSNTTASGVAAFAVGERTIASGKWAYSEGKDSTASGDSSHTEGYSTGAWGNSSHAEGDTTLAIGSTSHAEGYKTRAEGNYSHVEGSNTKSSPYYLGSSVLLNSTNYPNSYEISYNSQYDNYFSLGKTLKITYIVHLFNYYSDPYTLNAATITTSISSINKTTHILTLNPSLTWTPIDRINDTFDYIEFTDVYVGSGNNSHAEGDSTSVYGVGSHVEGFTTSALGDYSHAEGYITSAFGDNSHAQNTGTVARGKSQTVIGEYNILQGTATTRVSSDFAFIIGNGTDDTHRSNVFTVNWDGVTRANKTFGTVTFILTDLQGNMYGQFYNDGGPLAIDAVEGMEICLYNNNLLSVLGNLSVSGSFSCSGPTTTFSTVSSMSDKYYSGDISSDTCAENLYWGNLLYLSSTGYKKSLAASDSNYSPCVGMSISNANSGYSINVLKIGHVCNASWSFNKGDLLYVSPTTPGAITNVRPSSSGNVVQIIGQAIGTNKIYFNPQYMWITI